MRNADTANFVNVVITKPLNADVGRAPIVAGIVSEVIRRNGWAAFAFVEPANSSYSREHVVVQSPEPLPKRQVARLTRLATALIYAID